jgi:hypothetical protein
MGNEFADLRKRNSSEFRIKTWDFVRRFASKQARFRAKAGRIETNDRIGKLPMVIPQRLGIIESPSAADVRDTGQSILDTRPLQR